jgi:hypothetical protein
MRAVQPNHPALLYAHLVGLFDRLRIRRNRGSLVASLDREATPDDLDAVRSFARTRTGVELYVEPETMVTDTTVVAIATDGEWTRRRVGSPAVARRLARELAIPVYDVQIVGYPPRMRAYNARLKAEGRTERMLPRDAPPPVRTQRPPASRPEHAPKPPKRGGDPDHPGPGTAPHPR